MTDPFHLSFLVDRVIWSWIVIGINIIISVTVIWHVKAPVRVENFNPSLIKRPSLNSKLSKTGASGIASIMHCGVIPSLRLGKISVACISSQCAWVVFSFCTRQASTRHRTQCHAAQFDTVYAIFYNILKSL
jgi:hypothetical protein